MPPPSQLSLPLLVLAAASAPRFAEAVFSVTGGVASQSFVALVAGDGSGAGAPMLSKNTVACSLVEYSLSYAPATGAVSILQTGSSVTLQSSGFPVGSNPYQLSLPGDYADRGTASGVVTLSGTSCTAASASTPTLACQGVPLTGQIAMTEDNKYVTLAGYDLPAGTPIVPPYMRSTTVQNLTYPAASVDRVLAAVDLTTLSQTIAVSANAGLRSAAGVPTTVVPYPAEITSAFFWKNSSDPSGGGQWFAGGGFGTSSTSTTAHVWLPSASGLPLRGTDGGLAATITSPIGLPGMGGIVSIAAPQGIAASTTSNIGAVTNMQYGASGSTYYIKYVRSPKVYNGYLYYVLNSKGVGVCPSGIPPPGVACAGVIVAQIYNGFANTGLLDVRDFVFTGATQLWVLDADAGLHAFAMSATAPTAAAATTGQLYSTMPPGAVASNAAATLTNASVVGLAAVQVQTPLTTFILVAQVDKIWAWPAANSGGYVDGIGNCCGPANRGTAGASCCWANNNQPVAAPPTNTRFRSLTSPAFGTAAMPSPAASVSPSATPTLSLTSSVTPSVTPTISTSPSGSPSYSGSPSNSASITPSASTTMTPTPTVTPTASLSSGASSSRTPSNSVSSSITPSATQTPTNTPTPSRTPSTTISISATPSVTPSQTPSRTPSQTPSSSSTPTPSLSKGAAAPAPYILTWQILLAFGGPASAALTPAQKAMMAPQIVCDAYVASAITGGFAQLLQLPGPRPVAITGTTDSVTGATTASCSRRALEGLAGDLGRSLGRRALQATSSELVSLRATFGGFLSNKDQQAALLAVTSFGAASPAYHSIAAAMAQYVNTTADAFVLSLDASSVDLENGAGPVVATKTDTTGTSTVGGVLGGIVGAVFIFACVATLRYYLVKGRLPPIFGKSTKTSAQKRDIAAVRNENEALKANPLAHVKLSREDSVVVAGLVADMTPEEIEEMKEMKRKKREAAKAKKLADAAAASGASSPSSAGAGSPSQPSLLA